MRKISIFDLISLSVIALLTIFSAARFNYLPQFIDGYYHLSVANGFIQSGGWTGWAWWDFAPFGRPHLYPPFYHLILVFLIKAGISGLNALRFTEILIIPLFFFVLWFVSRSLTDDKFAFLNLFVTSSFFAFYSSVSANVPASLAIIFGLLSWFFFKKHKWISAALCLLLSFYTHAGIPWIFFTSFIFVTIFNKEYRKPSLKIIFYCLIAFLPFILHELRYVNFVNLKALLEKQEIFFNIFIILSAFITMCFTFKKRGFVTLLFWGYFITSALIFLVFARYPYRFFSAQGLLGFAFFSSLGLVMLSKYFGKKQQLFLVLVSLYLFFINSTIVLDQNKIKFRFFDSTFHNFLVQKAYDNVIFAPIFSEKFDIPILEVIQKNSSSSDIISSNNPVCAQLFSSLSNRPSGRSMLKEVRTENNPAYYDYAKIIVWIKPIIKEEIIALEGKKVDLLFENGIAYVFLNKDYLNKDFIKSAPVSFVCIYFIFIVAVLIVIKDNYKPKSRRLGKFI